jgi:glutaminyl-tRNA synthetase
VRLYDRLFNAEEPGASGDYRTDLNPDSLEVIQAAKAEPSLASAPIGHRVQFERLGYFCVDPDTAPGRLVLNRTVTLKDTWAKIESRG